VCQAAKWLKSSLLKLSENLVRPQFGASKVHGTGSPLLLVQVAVPARTLDLAESSSCPEHALT
jgi:hypothetical protein